MKHATVHLGFEVGTGLPVAVPLQHLVITGQTQCAGKTTALEAMISRSGLRAICFVTKRGEGSFLNARRIDPYFREEAHWQFVASILEASRGEKLKFERAWIIRASKGARTLADVQRNVKAAMEKARGMSADVYLTLDAYLDAVVPQISSVHWATSVSLGPGVNAMDLTDLNVEMQHLVIKSSIDWVLNKEENTVVVVPEAWKFIPQGRGTPVKLAAESYIRQAAGLKNFLWLDSQDIAGVEKLILKSVPVWILGVQREFNEVKRTLAQIPAGIKKPKADQIATLGLGNFFVCHGEHIVKAYAQPAWLDDSTAKSIAIGKLNAAEVRAPEIEGSKMHGLATAQRDQELRRLRDENADLKKRIEELEEALTVVKTNTTRLGGENVETSDRSGESLSRQGVLPPLPADANGLYEGIRDRLLRDPKVLSVLADQPEIEVLVQRQKIEVDGKTLRGRVALLISEGFFDDGRTGSAAYTELKRRGFSTAKPNVYKECDKLAEIGFLTKEAEGYRSVPKMKVRIVEE